MHHTPSLTPNPQKATGTTGTYPGLFLGFSAASTKFALVWEQLPSNNPNKTVVHLQQYDGTKWTIKMRVNMQVLPDGPPQDGWQPTITTPLVQVSVASPTRAIVTLTHLLPGKGTTATVATHTWDGNNWTQHTNSTFVRPAYSHWQDLQASPLWWTGSCAVRAVQYELDQWGSVYTGGQPSRCGSVLRVQPRSPRLTSLPCTPSLHCPNTAQALNSGSALRTLAINDGVYNASGAAGGMWRLVL